MLEVFLEVFKKACKNGCFDFVSRDKNMDLLSSLGLTKTQAVKELCGKLSAEHYIGGPEKDKDEARGGDVWMFKLNLWEIEVYVKLKVFTSNEKYCIKCISFHA